MDRSACGIFLEAYPPRGALRNFGRSQCCAFSDKEKKGTGLMMKS